MIGCIGLAPRPSVLHDPVDDPGHRGERDARPAREFALRSGPAACRMASAANVLGVASRGRAPGPSELASLCTTESRRSATGLASAVVSRGAAACSSWMYFPPRRSEATAATRQAAMAKRDRLTADLAAIPLTLVTGPVEGRITAHFAAALAQAGKTALAALDGRRYLRLLDDLDALLVRPPLTPLAERRAGTVLAKPVRRAARRLLRALAAVPAAENCDAAIHEARKAANGPGTPQKRQCLRSAARPAGRPNRPRTCRSCSATTTIASSPGQCCSISPEGPGRQGGHLHLRPDVPAPSLPGRQHRAGSAPLRGPRRDRTIGC